MFEVHVFKDQDQLSQKAFEVVRETLKEPNPVLGLATGSSPVGLYAKLVEAHKQGLSMDHVTTVNLDEYVGLDPNHPQSYRTFMFEHLFNHVDVPLENIHLPKGQGALEPAVRNYEAFLAAHPQDLQVLGIGSNGHIGFNEPGCSFDSTVHIETLKETTRQDNARFFDSIDEVPQFAVTMGIADILRAKKILLIATGTKKAEAVKAMIHGEVSKDHPCTILQKHPNVIVLLDEAAASLLPHD